MTHSRDTASPNHSSDGGIGVFDSGVGGLTVLREILRALPNEDCMYLGDTARIPYGTKSPETVVRFARKNADFLVSQGIKFLIVACNTAASAGIDAIREHAGVPTIGVIRPGAARACRVSKNGRIGVIGTRATVSSGAYEREIKAVNRDMQVYSAPCPLFVPLAEEGWVHDDITIRIAERYLVPLNEQGIDVLVLGCTHYPLLKVVLAQVMGENVRLIDSAEAVAGQVAESLKLNRLLVEDCGDGSSRALTVCLTDRSPHFIQLGEKILEVPLDDTEYVDIG